MPLSQKQPKTRLDFFFELKDHPWFARLVKRLNNWELEYCVAYMRENAHMSKNEFAFQCNRMGMGDDNKPKNWPIMWELMTVANSNLEE